MRKAYNDVTIITDSEKEDKFIGISLGYDFCAEHEWGIKGLIRTFGMDTSKIGLDGRTITKSEVIYKEKGDLALIRTKGYSFEKSDEKSFDECLPFDLKNRDERKELHTAWSEEAFCVVAKKEIIKELYDAFEDLNVVIARVGSGAIFAGTALSLLIKDRLPDEVAEQFRYADQKSLDLKSYEGEIGMTELKERVYKSNYSNDFDEKKDKYWMALSPRWTNYKNENPDSKVKNKTEYDIQYWVNYGDNETYGWFTVEQIKQWLENPDVKLKSLGGNS